ncbi:MAG: radical SAM protein [archaeon]
MKITLVNPNQLNPFRKHPASKRSLVFRDIGPPPTLASLLGSLGYDHDVKLIDHFLEYQHLGPDDVEVDLEAAARREFPDSDVIGISTMTNSRKASLDFVRLAREISNARVIVGGPHATTMARQLLEHYPIDAAVLREAEITFPELIRAIETGGDLRQVEGIAIRPEGEFLLTKPRQVVTDLDDLPTPDYNPYFELDHAHEIKTISTMTSRGCPHRCKFCSNYWGKRVRTKSVGKVVQELTGFADLGVKTVRVEDDTLTLNSAHAKKLFREIGAAGLGLELHAITRFGTLDDEMAELYVRAGGKSFDSAIETGSASLRGKMGKALTNRQIYGGAEILKRAGIDMYLYVMLGFPGETERDLEATMSMLERLQPAGLTCSIFHPYPELRQYEELRRQGLVSDEDFLDEDKTKLHVLEGEELELRRRYRREILKGFGLTKRPDYEGMLSDGVSSYTEVAEG